MNYSSYPFTLINRIDKRGGFVHTITGVLYVEAPAEAKYVDIKVTFSNGASFSLTLHHKEYYSPKKYDIFRYSTQLTSNCQTASYCWTTIVRNDIAQYSPYPYAEKVHVPNVDFYKKYLRTYVMPSNNTAIPDSYTIPTVVEYKMYK